MSLAFNNINNYPSIPSLSLLPIIGRRHRSIPTSLQKRHYGDDVAHVDFRFNFLGSELNGSALRLSRKEYDPEQENKSSNNISSLFLVITSIIGIMSSCGTLWSEFAVMVTGCGPLQLPDAVERGCYLGTLTFAGLSVFTRIVSGQGISASLGRVEIRDIELGDDEVIVFSPLFWLQIAEVASLIGVLMAFVALGMQEFKGEKMDGLSGINIDMCRAIQQSI